MLFLLLKKLKSAVKSDRNWGPEDPMLQHQWHQISSKSSDQGVYPNASGEEECTESKNVKFIMKRIFTSSTPKNTNIANKGISNFVLLCFSTTSLYENLMTIYFETFYAIRFLVASKLGDTESQHGHDNPSYLFNSRLNSTLETPR
jgi:hypothetical protein